MIHPVIDRYFTALKDKDQDFSIYYNLIQQHKEIKRRIDNSSKQPLNLINYNALLEKRIIKFFNQKYYKGEQR
jgi:hypothetical protein